MPSGRDDGIVYPQSFGGVRKPFFIFFSFLFLSFPRGEERLQHVCVSMCAYAVVVCRPLRPFFLVSDKKAVLLVSDKLTLHNVPAVCAYRILLCFRTQRTSAGFDAVLQFRDRVSSYIANGHPIDKIEILVLGGTWSEYPEGYQVRVVVASDSAVCPGCFFLFLGDAFCAARLLRPPSWRCCVQDCFETARKGRQA